MNKNKISKIIAVLEKFNDTIFTNTPEMVNAVDDAIEILEQLTEREV